MLRLFVLLLLIANLGYWAWSGGHFGEAGLGPGREREPERLARQLRPDALTVQPLTGAAAASAGGAEGGAAALAPPLPPPMPAPASASAPAPASAAPPIAAAAQAGVPYAPASASDGACLQVGVFDARQTDAVRAAAAALPPGSWRIDQVALPGRWMVYIGKLADDAAVAAKRTEVRALGVDTDRPGPGFEPGLSLGRFASEDAAQRALTEVTRKGVRSARVVQERGNAPAFVLRLPAADAALRDQLRTLRPALAGREARPCS
ncbi:MAG: SPOR domain-containing protein [Burkholderiaceae bacterium]|jgi:hypothetical protein|nr:SPOR domain-containing protein [Burkholderiaceae bacterium]